MPPAPDPRLLRDIDEDTLLGLIFPLLPAPGTTLLGAGDDAAVVAAPDGRVVATTDTMVRGSDWLDVWSTGRDVGTKVVAQNVADVAAMGAVPTGLLVTLCAEPATPVQWALDLTEGIAAAAADAGTGVIGGDLSSAPDGLVTVSITALGDLQGRDPVRRDGARDGDVVAVAGTLGRSGAGLALLSDGRAEADPGLVAAHLRPRPPYERGPEAARAGAHAMIDLSDGLVRDAGRVARSSGVAIDLHAAALAPDIDALAGVVGAERGRACVLGGGEEHSLLATFAPGRLPPGWRPIGRVVPRGAGAPVRLDGEDLDVAGWDHFAR